MRLVLDTNTVISGLLWNGPPRRLLDAAISGAVDQQVSHFMALAHLTAPAAIEGAVLADPDDDHVIACALAAQADVIVSGDVHLLNLKHYQGLRIIDAAEVLRALAQ